MQHRPTVRSDMPLPDIGKWQDYVLHRHYESRQRRSHWDLRIHVPASGGLRSFALRKRKLPKKGERGVLGIETAIHPKRFLTFERLIIPDHQYGAGVMRIMDSGKYYTHQASATRMVITFRGKRLRGTYDFIRTKNANWVIRKHKSVLKPRMKTASKPFGSRGQLWRLMKQWRAADPKWWKVADTDEEYTKTALAWRKLMHDFWKNTDKYIPKIKEISWDKFTPHDLWQLKEDCLSPSTPAGQFVLKVVRLIRKEAKLGILIAKRMKLRLTDPRRRRYQRLAEITPSSIYRLAVVLTSDTPQLWSRYDQQAAGYEWEQFWQGFGVLREQDAK